MAVSDDINLLQQLDFFKVFPEDALRMILFAAERRKLAEGEKLFSKGSPSTGGYVVESGLIVLSDDADHVDLERLERGALIGEIALLASGERPVTAVARMDTQVIVLPRALMHRFLSEYPHLAKALADQITVRSQVLYQALQSLESSVLV
ncbi:MAG: Crp/Fnr family transcriptional regulator [Alphaproteobacteria bacterium]|nr:Crp/Fnr family transcriptional regulator [Alphaproteobacteria bacterium]